MGQQSRWAHWIISSIAMLGACAPADERPGAFVGNTDEVPAPKDGNSSSTTLVDTRAEPPGTNCVEGGVAILSGRDTNRNGRLDFGEVTTRHYVCNGTDGQDGREIILTSRDEPIGTACPTGGKAFSWGYDGDRNGVLGAGEVQHTEYICSGLNGANGTNGANGRDGTDGKNGLVVLIPQVPGERCPAGGVGVYAGLDLDGDGLLQPTEVQSSAFVCNGQAGQNGANGSNGASAAVRQTPESAGANCEHGGTRIETGLDDNGSGALDDAEVDHTSYVCDGAPGPAGPTGPQGPTGQPGLNVVSNLVPEPPGANCANGGVRLELGGDDDRDGVLDPGEIDVTQYVCNGANGGGAGELQQIIEEVPATQIPPYGGQRRTVWADGNGDGQIQETEILTVLTTRRLSRFAGGSGACSQGATAIELGLDVDGDAVLDDAEVLEQRCVARFATVSAGADHTCASLTDGTVRCWGSNGASQLGNAIATLSALPVAGVDLVGVAMISAGASQTCAALTDGTARCWGNGDDLPLPVDSVTGVATISAGGGHACAGLTDGTTRCWGDNSSGQLGNGTTTISALPVVVSGLTGVATISAGAGHTCAGLTDGTARCWGANWRGQLGDGTRTSSALPVAVSNLTGVATLSAGAGHTCATLLANGTAYCWGDNSSGQLGSDLSNFRPLESLLPVRVSSFAGALAISAGGTHTCARWRGLSGPVRVSCWGSNEFGQLGNGHTHSEPAISVVSDLMDLATISAGSQHTCATLMDGSARCWGANGDGQLGNGTTTWSTIPVPVAFPF